MERLAKKIKLICPIIISILFLFNFLDVSHNVNAAITKFYAPTSVKAVSSSYSSISVKWSGVTGVSGYEVYRATSSTGTYSLISTTKSVSYNNTGLTTNRNYYYKVRAYRMVGTAKVYSAFSNVVSSRPVLSIPTSIKAVSSSYNGISVKWNAAAGVSGYEVYRSTYSTGAYALISTTKSVSYNNTGLATNTTYYYKIRAYRIVGTAKVYSAFSAIVSSRPTLSVPTSIKAVSSSYNGISIKWNAAAGASGYEVYRSTYSTGAYALISTTKSVSYNNTGLATNTTYYHKIRAYRIVGTAKVYSAFSAIVSSRPTLSIPTSIKAASITYNSINISWGGVTGTSGYEVYRATSSTGTYALIATTKTVSYNNTGLTANKTYYYKVRAYIAAGTKKVYSNYSTVIRGTTTNNPTIVSSVSLSKTADVLTIGKTDTLIASVLPSTAANKAVTWTSSNSSVVSVDNTGKITAVSSGTATIRATTLDRNKTASCTVTVTDSISNVISVSLNKTKGVLTAGKTDTLTASILPSTAVNKAVTWTSSNSAVVSVDNTGKITAKSTGTATIKVTTLDGNKTAVCTVTVTKESPIKVAIDAGHGGSDTGAIGPTAIREKDVTLAIALKVGKILEQNGIDVVYTRTSDNVSWPSVQSEGLQARCDIANNAKVDYFLCIHANSYSGPSANGTETYYCSGSTKGKQLAQSIQNELIKNNGLLDRGIKTANYYVLKHTNAPAILTEVAFISNPNEESLLNSDNFQQKSAESIANGLLKILN